MGEHARVRNDIIFPKFFLKYMYCATLSKGFNIYEYQFKDFYKIECHQHVGCLEKKRPISTLYKSYAS